MLAFEETNLEGVLGVMIPIVAIVGGISLGFAGFYLRYRERMEMISRGMDVSKLDFPKRRRSPLRRGLTVLGAGIGLLLAYWLCNSGILKTNGNRDEMIIYFGFVATFVGLAMILSHMIEKKEPAEGADLGKQ
jgi:hypothetical protein